jgi:Transposase DDE domain group 1
VRLSHAWRASTAVFDDKNLVSCAGLVPVLELAEQAGLSELLDEHVVFVDERVRSGAANPVPKLTSIIAGMLAGADSIDDLEVIRSGGMKRLFAAVYASATLGIFLREFTLGHVRQLGAVLRRHLLALAARTDLLAGLQELALVDIDSLLRPVYGHGKQGASFGHTKIGSRQVLRLGLSPLVTTISTPRAAPVIAGLRLRAGRAGSGRGAASMITEAINTAKAAGATNILCRGDSAYGTSKVIAAVVKAGAKFSFVLTRSPSVNRAISSIPDDIWTPVRYPGAITDPDTGDLISDAEVAEVKYTAFATTKQKIIARLIVRRVRDRNHDQELFPVWRYHPFFTNSTETITTADITHRQHATIETVFADLIDGPWAHQPSGLFPANGAWTMLAAIAHNLLRAAGTLIDTGHAVARGATLRRRIVTVPARVAKPQGKPVLHLPAHWPHADQWKQLWDNTFTDQQRKVAA